MWKPFSLRKTTTTTIKKRGSFHSLWWGGHFGSGPWQLSWCHLSHNGASYCETSFDSLWLPRNRSGRWETGALGTPVSVRRRMKGWENDGGWRWEVLDRDCGRGGRQAGLPVIAWMKVSDKHTHSRVGRRGQEKREESRGVWCGTTML